MFQQLGGGSGNVLGFKIGENITGEDVHEMSTMMAGAIAVSGKIRLLIEIEGFRHMEPEALLEKLKFARDHSKYGCAHGSLCHILPQGFFRPCL
jgi:hypothetical protein